MNTMRTNLHFRVHNWMDKMGFRLNSSQTNERKQEVTRHYFFETFNFFEKIKTNEPEKSKFVCFDPYGETLKVKSLLDLQTAFYENISQLK